MANAVLQHVIPPLDNKLNGRGGVWSSIKLIYDLKGIVAHGKWTSTKTRCQLSVLSIAFYESYVRFAFGERGRTGGGRSQARGRHDYSYGSC